MTLRLMLQALAALWCIAVPIVPALAALSQVLEIAAPRSGFSLQDPVWLGDVNGDGYDDVAVWCEGPGGDRARCIYFGGSTPDGIEDVVLEIPNGGSAVGPMVSGPFDYNADGFGDIAMGSRGYVIDGMQGAGAVFVWYGGPALDPIADVIIPGWWTRYYFGLDPVSVWSPRTTCVPTPAWSRSTAGDRTSGTRRRSVGGRARMHTWE